MECSHNMILLFQNPILMPFSYGQAVFTLCEYFLGFWGSNFVTTTRSQTNIHTRWTPLELQENGIKMGLKTRFAPHFWGHFCLGFRCIDVQKVKWKMDHFLAKKWAKKWAKNGSKMGQKWVKNGSKMGYFDPFWGQNDPILGSENDPFYVNLNGRGW